MDERDLLAEVSEPFCLPESSPPVKKNGSFPRITDSTGKPCSRANEKAKAKEVDDTISLTDILASAGPQDDLLDARKMCSDLAKVSMAEMYSEDPVPSFQERNAPVAGPSTHASALILDQPIKKPEQPMDDSTPEKIYTPHGWFRVSRMPYELFYPASTQASELAKSFTPEDGQVRCAEWRAGAEHGQWLSQIDEMMAENHQAAAEFRQMEAKLRNLMRRVGQDTPVAPPKIPEVKIIQASPESSLE
ncbi:hypothetical protein H0H87_012366, partial [Tephrocybe sp. NHM501043]